MMQIISKSDAIQRIIHQNQKRHIVPHFPLSLIMTNLNYTWNDGILNTKNSNEIEHKTLQYLEPRGY